MFQAEGPHRGQPGEKAKRCASGTAALGDIGQVDWRGSKEGNRMYSRAFTEKKQEDWLPADSELGGLGLGDEGVEGQGT